MSDNPDGVEYGLDFYNALLEDWPHQQRAVLGCCALFGVPPSYADVGCGSGATVDIMAQLIGAKNAMGFERREFFTWLQALAPNDRPRGSFEPLDLAHEVIAAPLPAYSLVTSWEVGEHLPTDSSTLFCSTLAKLTAPGGRLVFTAGQPGQPGHGHINCQPKSFWVEQISMQGFEYRQDFTEWMTELWNLTVNPLLWLRDNVLVFNREGAAP